MNHGDSEFWGYEKLRAFMTSLLGVKEKTLIFDLTLRLELMLESYSAYFRMEQLFQETRRLGVF